MKTWQQQGTPGTKSKERPIWYYNGECKLNQLVRRLWTNNTLRNKYFYNRTDWNSTHYYDFVGWDTITSTELGAECQYSNVYDFYTVDWNRQITSAGAHAIKIYDHNLHILINDAVEGRAYMIFRIFRYPVGTTLPVSASQDMTPMIMGDSTTMGQDHKNALFMDFLWKYKIPGYNVSTGACQYRYRNMYRSYPTAGDPESEENEIIGGAYPNAKPSLNRITSYYPYPEVPSPLQQITTMPIDLQAYYDYDNYSINYNTIWYPVWKIMVPIVAEDAGKVKRGFNKWLFDIGKISSGASWDMKDETYQYVVEAVIVLGA